MGKSSRKKLLIDKYICSSHRVLGSGSINQTGQIWPISKLSWLTLLVSSNSFWRFPKPRICSDTQNWNLAWFFSKPEAKAPEHVEDSFLQEIQMVNNTVAFRSFNHHGGKKCSMQFSIEQIKVNVFSLCWPVFEPQIVGMPVVVALVCKWISETKQESRDTSRNQPLPTHKLSWILKIDTHKHFSLLLNTNLKDALIL